MLSQDLDDLSANIYKHAWLRKIPQKSSENFRKYDKLNIKCDLYQCSIVQASPNLSKNEQKALGQLVKDDSLIISKVVKRDLVVVLSTAAYLELAYEHHG